jgi:hypothetical protein
MRNATRPPGYMALRTRVNPYVSPGFVTRAAKRKYPLDLS